MGGGQVAREAPTDAEKSTRPKGVRAVSPTAKKKKPRGLRSDHPTISLHLITLHCSTMDEPTTQGSPLKQPKKRFVGRRTADAQAQKETGTQQDVESTSVQRGMQDLQIYVLLTLTLYSHWIVYSRTTTQPSDLEPSPAGNPKRPGNPSGHRITTEKLLLRDPQNHPSCAHIRSQAGGPSVPRGTVDLRNHHL